MLRGDRAFSGGDESALGKGPGLMFITLPKVFDSMPGGNIIGAAFFIMVLFAALTSAISLMETIVSVFQDKLKMKRIPACLTVLGISLVLGVVTCLGYSAWSSFTIIGMQLLDFFDFISNNILMPITALATAIFVGYILKPKAIIEEAEECGNTLKGKKLFTVMIKYIAPVFIVLILVSSILDFFGIVKI